MLVRDIMTDTPLVLPHDATLVDAAQTMRTNDVGDVLITDDDGHLHGVITDRDIVVRAIADGHLGSARVGEHATTDVQTVAADDDTPQALRLMREHALRRLPVLDHDHQLVGVVSLGDLAVCTPEGDLTATLTAISAAPPNK